MSTDAEPPPVAASPAARKLAEELGVDLGTLAGTGPKGRIRAEDVTAAAGGPAPAAAAVEIDAAKGEVQTIALSRIQKIVARRMAESKATVPEFALDAEVDMERALALRAELKAREPDRAPSVNDMIVKASALALREHPRANGAYRDGTFQLHGRVNVGIAVAAADALIVPTIADADRKPLAQIAQEARALAEKARSGTIAPPELAGGTFTVSNLGMFGITRFTAVVNPPQAAILAVGATVRRAREHDGALALRSVMAVTLTCDHRILYGAEAARFLGRIQALLEDPDALLA